MSEASSRPASLPCTTRRAESSLAGRLICGREVDIERGKNEREGRRGPSCCPITSLPACLTHSMRPAGMYNRSIQLRRCYSEVNAREKHDRKHLTLCTWTDTRITQVGRQLLHGSLYDTSSENEFQKMRWQLMIWFSEKDVWNDSHNPARKFADIW